MKSSDRAVLLGLLILGVGAAFWFMVLAPKRERASELETQISTAQTELDQAEATVAAAEQAKAQYEDNYRTVVTLGKAAPSEADAASLVTQFQTLAEDANVEFMTLELFPDAASDTETPTQQTTTDQASESTESTESTPAATPPAPTGVATEAAASSLPLGAAVGPAGLPVMPYKLQLTGDFFQMADFLENLDQLVGEGEKALQIGGRLLTINGFSIETDDQGEAASTHLLMKLTLTTYVTPEDEGVTAGATPTAPATPAEPTPVAAPAGTVTP